MRFITYLSAHMIADCINHEYYRQSFIQNPKVFVTIMLICLCFDVVEFSKKLSK